MKLPGKLNARLSLLLLVFGVLLICVNFVRNRTWFQERRVARLSDGLTETGVRLSGMMQHFFRRGLVASAELEMSYAAITPQMELGVVCDSTDHVRYSTRLEWVNASLSQTPMNVAAILAEEARSSMSPKVTIDREKGFMMGAFPFYEQYHSRNRGVVLLRYDLSLPLKQVSSDALLESLAQACLLLAVCLLLWVVLDWMVTRRVRELAAYAKAVTRGESSPPDEEDELSLVARSFESAVADLITTESRLLEASEAERRRIGSDLHDDVCQRVAAAQLKSGVLEAVLVREGHAKAELAHAVAEELAKAAQVARGFARGLAPVSLGDGGLPQALSQLCAFIEESFGIRCDAQCDLKEVVLSEAVATHVYRVVQELATNAAKHAHPTWIRLRVCCEKEGLEAMVENDGGAFDGGVEGGPGLGLSLVRQRVRALSGILSFKKRLEPDGGTIARCVAPLLSIQLSGAT